MKKIKNQINIDGLELILVHNNKLAEVTLNDKNTGKRWGPASLLTLDVFDKPLKRIENVDKWRIEHVEPVENGLHVMISDNNHGIEIGIWLRLYDGELSVLLSPSEIYERDSVMYRLFAVNILPDLMNVQNGTLLLPINTGMLCPTTGKPAIHDRFLIYGEQERWELTPSLPFCACWDNDAGIMALARQGACDAECRVETDGKNGGETGFSMSLRRTWIDPVDYTNREIRFIPIKEKSDPVIFCAKRLRQHIMIDLGKKTLVERAAESPEVAYLMDAYIMKLFHGIENVGYMMEGKQTVNPGSFQSYMPFSEATACLKKLKQAGIEKIVTQCVGWNTKGHDGLYPTRFPVEERLGGETGFRNLIRTGIDLGFNIQVHDNFIMQNLNSPDFNRDYAIIDIFGEPLIHGRWAGGPEASGWPLAMPEERIAGHLKHMKNLGLKGMYYVDYMQQPLEVNYHPKYKGPRADCAKGQVLIVEECKRVFGACGTEFGFLPCAVAADHISTCGDPWHLTMCKPEWPVFTLIDRKNVVPVWQIAMSGLVALEARGGVKWDNVMACILYGGIPRDEWSTKPGVMPVLNDTRIAALKAVNDICITQYGHLKKYEITDYKKLCDDAYSTSFADGTEVTADFEKHIIKVNDKEIVCPEILVSY
ncbi:MAG: DUF5696 domain-containing protein [bacterium]